MARYSIFGIVRSALSHHKNWQLAVVQARNTAKATEIGRPMSATHNLGYQLMSAYRPKAVIHDNLLARPLLTQSGRFNYGCTCSNP
jgi:hypothetical protein